MRQTLRLLWVYFKQAYVRWWTAAYLALIGAYDLLDRAIPKEVWDVPDLTAQALWWLALPLFFAAPFPVFLALTRRLNTERNRLKEHAEFNRQIALAAELDLRFGPSSNWGADRRFAMASDRFEELEREILSGNFRNAGEVIIFKEIFPPILRGWFAGGTGYPEWHDRLISLVDAVGAYQRELAAQARDESPEFP